MSDNEIIYRLDRIIDLLTAINDRLEKHASISEVEIKEVRKRKGMTQKELAQRLGVTASAVSQYEKPGANLTQETLQKIAAALDCRVNELMR